MDDRDKILLAVVGAAFVALWLLTWHQYATDAHDEDWTDPHQPPDNVGPAVLAVPQASRTLPVQPRCKAYPGSLMGWDGSVVGSC